MKRLLCLLLALIFALSLCACGDNDSRKKNKNDRNDTSDTAPRGNQIGDLAYDAQLTEISEDGVALSTFDPTALGKITVINFWAYWCGPCMRELPAFSQIAEDYGDEVAVIAVHCDDLAKAQETIGENFADSAIRFAKDNGENPYAYYEKLGGSGSIPYTVVLDANGIIRKTFVGAIEYDTLAEVIEDCRANSTPIVTTQHQVALQRGNQVGDVCYDAQLPVITADGIQEETVDPTSFGKVTVINFWGTWCAPSVEEMSGFNAIAKKHSEKVKVVAVHGMMSSTAPAFIAQNYPDSPITFLSDTGEQENDYHTLMGGNGVYPLTVVINTKGIITHVFPSYVQYDPLETAVLQALGRM